MKFTHLLFGCAAVVCCFSLAWAESPVNACLACHGKDGNVPAQGVPAPLLGGQSASYLKNQLVAFKTGARAESMAAFMAGAVANLDDGTMEDLAQYYSTKTGVVGTPADTSLIAAGKRIFERGIPKRDIPKCTTCHGSEGQGVEASDVMPHLAGQNAQYLVQQLQFFKTGERADPPWQTPIVDKEHRMTGIAKNMTTDEMNAIGAYMSFLSSCRGFFCFVK